MSNVKTGPPYYACKYLEVFWFFGRLLLFAFSLFFKYLTSVDIYNIRTHYNFQNFSVCCLVAPYDGQWVSFRYVFPTPLFTLLLISNWKKHSLILDVDIFSEYFASFGK